jgi:hypothetical protein
LKRKSQIEGIVEGRKSQKVKDPIAEYLPITLKE